MELHFHQFAAATGETNATAPDGSTEQQVLFMFTPASGPLKEASLIFHLRRDVAEQMCSAVLKTSNGRLAVPVPGFQIPPMPPPPFPR